MEEIQPNKRSSQWMVFIGVVLLLFGIYGLARTCINIFAFEKYPQEGVYPPFPFFQSAAQIPYYAGREEDCIANYVYYPTPYLSYPGLPHDIVNSPDAPPLPSAEELKKNEELVKIQNEMQKQNCLSGIKEAREKARVNDLSQSVLFLFLGAGVLIARRIFK
ncbi:MAG TPA: hypothetical protein VJH63_00215 [Candidatus Paceibacterota bacterium]